MITPVAQYALADICQRIRQVNEQHYMQLVSALSQCIDPEYKLLLSCPDAELPRQRGRAQLGTELLEIVYQCQNILAQRQQMGAGMPAKPMTNMGVINGG